MSLGRTHAVALLGLEGVMVEVEAAVGNGLPGFTLIGLPDAKLTASQQEALEKARDAAIRRLNDEIALTISNWTGLTR